MKSYSITVNGTTYQVQVEENNGVAGAVTAAAAAPAAAAPVPQAAPPVPAPAPAAPAPAAPALSSAGSVRLESPMPGKILGVKSAAGSSVKKGDVLLILEAMKMENDIVAPEDGVVASINVAVGDAVEAGQLLATLN